MKRSLFAAAIAGAAAAVGCGGAGDESAPLPVPSTVTLALLEDTQAQTIVPDPRPEGSVLTYKIVTPPANGTLAVDPVSGTLTYIPRDDFNGSDAAAYVTTNGRKSSAAATIEITVEPVNDAPVILPVSDATNSAEDRLTRVPLSIVDVDGDIVTVAVHADDASVAHVTYDPVSASLLFESVGIGTTAVKVTVDDGSLQAVQSLQFSVGPSTKHREWRLDDVSSAAVSIENTSDQTVAFSWRHADMPVASNRREIMFDVERSQAGLPVDQALWRYVADNTYPWYPTTELGWIHDPLVLINSIGFGFCDDVATAMALLAREAGLESRVWRLSGHVVPEVKVGERWAMLDPDLAVYYKTIGGSTASVAELASNPELITAPMDPVQPESASAYWQEIADIYGSTSDNTVDDYDLEGPDRLSGQVELPAGARITYPGKWSDGLIGAEASQIYPAPAYAQLKLDLPAGYSGVIQLPFVLWDSTGEGQVTISDQVFAIGSTELTDRLHSWSALPTGILLRADSPVSLIFLVNPLRFGMEPVTRMDLTALEAWVLTAELVPLDPAHRLSHSTSKLRRP
jgi:hypothetical protein